MFFRKKKRSSPLAEVGHTLSEVGHTISDAGHNLTGRVQETLRHAPEKLGDLKHTVGDAVAHVSDAVSHVGEAVLHVRDAVSAMEPKLDRARAVVSKAQQKAQQQAQNAQQQAIAQKDRLLPRFRAAAAGTTAAVAEVSQRVEDRGQQARESVEEAYCDQTNKYLWLGIGVAIGVIIGILLAPASGRRSRALVKDKLNKGKNKAVDAGSATVHKVVDAGHKAQGLAHRIEEKVRGGEDDADDSTVADRVRTALGQNEVTSALERLNIDVVDGLVTVRGPLVETAVREAIEAVILAVKGVREVKSELLEDSEDDSATFVG